MSDSHDHLTVIVMANETAPLRRLRLRRKWLKNGVAVLGFVLVGWTAMSVDYVRLRIERPEVAAIRGQNEIQEEELSQLQERVDELDAAMDEIRELERKVRIIADLPAKTEGPKAKEPEDGETQPKGGIGGEAEDSGVDEVERVSRKLTPAREGLSDLVIRLEAKKERLAAMPSIRPTDGWVTSSYGYRVSPFTGRRQFHRGLDIAADYGTVIVAPARGRVTFAGKKGPLGRAVILDHGYGTETTYGHAKETFVKKGDTVERGARIASVGSSGRSTGPHLHYGVTVRGKSVDPGDFILE